MMYINAIEIEEMEKSLETIAQQIAMFQERTEEEQSARKARNTVERSLATIHQVFRIVECVCCNWLNDKNETNCRL